MKTKHIFMVEDDPNFGAVLQAYLKMHNFEVVWVDDGEKAMNTYGAHCFDLCILDVMLPNKDGFRIAEEIKAKDAAMPLIFLTAKTLKPDILKGYQIGADDYITKPFDSDVLIYKINAILKRNKSKQEAEEATEIEIGKFTFNTVLRTITINKNVRKLSPKEAELLKYLCKHKNQVLYREEALNNIWGEDSYFTTRSMDVYITKLRKYLKEDPNIEIENIHGSGYSLRIRGE